MAGCGTGPAAVVAFLLVVLAVLVQVRSAPLDDTYVPYSVNGEPQAGQGGSGSEAGLIRRLLDDLRAGQIRYRTQQKRTCLFNGGMSHSCDYKDAVGAMDEDMFYNSLSSPGKRRRRSA
ncbi:uncharacterized protein LOC119092068 [Pollicipes pollicipes]|uniref:uncharacterized protein LOC119092068 n=1 Tax=Pollicipes pollicipes TaxID=41117 RepID=UPI00188514BA|nr:uncharacterized protein LOC119092068 [Pollicipes pollicipes]